MKKQKIVFGVVLGAVILLLIPVALIISGVMTLPLNPRTPVALVTNPVGLRIEGFKQIDDYFSDTVSHDTDIFNFSDKITVAEGAVYTLSWQDTDTVIANNTIDLSEGDNLFYIGVSNGDKSALYNVCIRRRPLYSVTFNTRGGSDLAPVYVEEGTHLNIETPLLMGHDFSCWLLGNEVFDINQGVFNDLLLVAQWTPKIYNITYVTEIGTLSVQETTVTYNSLFVPDIPLENDLFEFYGWYTQDGEPITEQVWKFTEDAVLTAKWTSKAFVVQDGVITSLTELGSTLTEIVVPTENGNEKIVGIADNVFAYNLQLTKITLPSLTRIGNYAFFGCNNLTDISCDVVDSVGREAFAKTAWLNSQSDGCVLLGSCLILYKGDFDGVVTLPDNVLSVADYAFDNKSISGVVFNDSLLRVGKHAFEDCKALFSVAVNESLALIDDFAFFGCGELQYPTLPPTTIVGYNAFPLT